MLCLPPLLWQGDQDKMLPRLPQPQPHLLLSGALTSLSFWWHPSQNWEVFQDHFADLGKEVWRQEQGEVTGIIALQLQQNCSLTAIWLSIPPCFQYFKVPGDFLPTPQFALLTKSGYSEDGGPGGFKREKM